MTTRERERRRFPRRRLSTPIGIDTERKRGRAGMTRDVSAGGILFHSRSTYQIGEEVELRFRPPGAEEERQARGRVVRTWEAASPDAFFRYLTAVRFHKPLAEELGRRHPGGARPRMPLEPATSRRW